MCSDWVLVLALVLSILVLTSCHDATAITSQSRENIHVEVEASRRPGADPAGADQTDQTNKGVDTYRVPGWRSRYLRTLGRSGFLKNA
jgi:hypothetical protein